MFKFLGVAVTVAALAGAVAWAVGVWDFNASAQVTQQGQQQFQELRNQAADVVRGNQ